MGSGPVILAMVLLPASVLSLFGVAEKNEYSFCGPQMVDSIETPACKVVERKAQYELRKYTNNEIWVETLVGNSTFESASLTGFYRCFSFISGRNSQGMKIEMTGPVHTTPVPHANGFKVGYFVPSRFKSFNDVPAPQDPAVHFSQRRGGVAKAVMGPFGGFPTDKDYEAKFRELKQALDKDGLEFDDETVVYAGYSSPFQFRQRKQEVHVNILA